MSEVVEAQIRRILEEVREGGPGHHIHLDQLLGASVPSVGDPRWIDLARQVAELALRASGRFIVTVPLGTSQALPLDLEISAITVLDSREPPAVYYVLDYEPPRTWTGEYFQLDLPETTDELLVYISASRTPEEREDSDPFDIRLYFEKRCIEPK